VQPLRLPFPPTANTHWRSVVIGGRVRVLISKRGREYRAAVVEHTRRHCLGAPRSSGEPESVPVGIRDAVRAAFGDGRTLSLFPTERLACLITVHPPDRRRRDLDNLLKSLLDSLQHAGLYADDSQIDQIHIYRSSIEKGGSVVVLLSEVE